MKSWLAACLGLIALITVMSESIEAKAEDIDRAKALFTAGAEAYSAGQYTLAIQAFDEAYRLAPRSAILFSTAQALRRQYFIDRDRAHLNRAIQFFRQYIAEVPEGGRRNDAVQALSELEPYAASLGVESGDHYGYGNTARATRLVVSSPTDGAKVSVDGAPPEPAPYIVELEPGKHRVSVSAEGYDDDVREVVAVQDELVTFDVRLRERPGELVLTAADGAHVYVDGAYYGDVPLSRPMQLPAGKHVVSVIKPGYKEFEQEVVLRRGETTTVEASQGFSFQRNASLVMLGAAGVSLVVSAGFFGQASDRQRAAEGVLDRKNAGKLTSGDFDVYETARRDRDLLRRAGTVVVGVAAGLGITGTMLYLFEKPHVPVVTSPGAPPKKDGVVPLGTLAVLPVAAPGLAGANLSGTF